MSWWNPFSWFNRKQAVVRDFGHTSPSPRAEVDLERRGRYWVHVYVGQPDRPIYDVYLSGAWVPFADIADEAVLYELENDPYAPKPCDLNIGWTTIVHDDEGDGDEELLPSEEMFDLNVLAEEAVTLTETDAPAPAEIDTPTVHVFHDPPLTPVDFIVDVPDEHPYVQIVDDTSTSPEADDSVAGDPTPEPEPDTSQGGSFDTDSGSGDSDSSGGDF